MDYVGVDGLESITASRKNYDVEVRCVSGVRDRYYEPETGRYVTSDPIGLEAGVNTFGYALQNPIYWADIDGLSSTKKGGKNWRRSPRIICINPNCRTPHGGAFGGYCRFCYLKSLDPKGGVKKTSYSGGSAKNETFCT